MNKKEIVVRACIAIPLFMLLVWMVIEIFSYPLF